MDEVSDISIIEVLLEMIDDHIIFDPSPEQAAIMREADKRIKEHDTITIQNS